MAFTLRITKVVTRGSEVAIVGKLETGRYFGPEQIAVPLKNGQLLKTCVGSMGAETPGGFGWPMLPEHGSILTLELTDHVKASDIEVGGLAEGLGTNDLTDSTFQLSNELLAHPEFWGAHIQERLGTEHEDTFEAMARLFSLDADKVNDFYVNNISVDPFPYFSKALPGNRTVEVCYYAGAEYQVRYSLRMPDNELILLGYDSGHFSLPTLRWAEVLQLANAHGKIANPRSRSECILLLLPSVYLHKNELKQVTEELKKAWTELGIISPENLDELVKILVENLSIKTKWMEDSERGWINDDDYSQRNPKSRMSELKPDQFRKIAAFFSDL